MRNSLWYWRMILDDRIALGSVEVARAVHAVSVPIVIGALIGGFPSNSEASTWLMVCAAAFALVAAVTGAQQFVGPLPSIRPGGLRVYETPFLGEDGLPALWIVTERVQQKIWGARSFILTGEAIVTGALAALL